MHTMPKKPEKDRASLPGPGLSLLRKQTSNESKLGQMSVDMSAIGMTHDHYEDNDTISNYFARSK